MGALMWRIAKALFVHLPMMLVVLGMIYLVVQGQESLGIAVRQQYAGASSQALLAVLDDARGDILTWCFACFVMSWLAASLFLVSAERARPTNEPEARSRIGLWSFLLLATIAFLFAHGWYSLLRPRLDLMPGTFIVAVLIAGVGVVLAYYLATGLMVRRVMRPSVPLAAGLPNLWS